MNVEVIFVDVFTIGRYEGIFRMVKIVDEALMKWKSCTQMVATTGCSEGTFSTAVANGVCTDTGW